jgi:outer membrane receptor for ferrienterochelin and colicins
LQAKHRFFGNIEFATHIVEKGRQWKFDYTFNWLGKQQLPNTASNTVADRLPEFSPSFSVMNVQMTRTFSSTFEMYIGGENIGDYKQENAILGENDPFGTHFDTSIVYAPVFGQMYYAGLRFKIKENKK